MTAFVRGAAQLGRDVGLGDFLREAGWTLEDVYRNAGSTWTGIVVMAEPARVAHRARTRHSCPGDLARLLHVDDPLRLASTEAL